MYEALSKQASALLADETDLVANAANFAALLFNSMERVNWLGFYFLRAGELVVGPFQGQPACVRIALGRGVCGVAARDDVVQRVADVHGFEGHIACDPLSRSEVVVPLHDKLGRVFGVLDVDSPDVARFNANDERGLVMLAGIFETAAARAAPGSLETIDRPPV